MPSPKTNIWLALGLATALAACGAQTHPRFMQQRHREMYQIGEQDLTRLQFYVSTKIIAHDVDNPGGAGVVLVDRGTPGVAVASGPRWVRVRFQQGGQGVVFLADPGARGDTGYALATEVAGAQGYQLVRNVPDHIVLVNNRRYRVVEGYQAELQVDDKTLEKLVEKRPHAQGQKVSEP